MKRAPVFIAALLAGAAAQAGGIERSGTPYAILWEEGNFAQLRFGHVSPRVSGDIAGIPSGNVFGSYNLPSLGVKVAVGERLSFAFVIDEPAAANTRYPVMGTPYPLAGTTAILDTRALNLLARYRFDNGFGAHAGLVIERMSGEAALPGWGYSLQADSDTSAGWLLGASYERPDIGLRVALTWQTAIRHHTATHENGMPSAPITVESPQAVTLDFQTGIAPDTLLFGQVRWREWSRFRIDPALYATMGIGPLAAYDHDSITWTLGLGHRFNDRWSASIAYSHERHFGDPVSNLSPVDGLDAITLGLRHVRGPVRVDLGVTWARPGRATTQIVGARFAGNRALGVGVALGYSF